MNGPDGPDGPDRSEPVTVGLFGNQDVALVDLLDRLLAGGVVLAGDITISLAGVDLVRVSLRALVTSIAPVTRPETLPPPVQRAQSVVERPALERPALERPALERPAREGPARERGAGERRGEGPG